MHGRSAQISQALISAGVIGDYRTPDRLRLGPVPITTRFTAAWDALGLLRHMMATDFTPSFLSSGRG